MMTVSEVRVYLLTVVLVAVLAGVSIGELGQQGPQCQAGQDQHCLGHGAQLRDGNCYRY